MNITFTGDTARRASAETRPAPSATLRQVVYISYVSGDIDPVDFRRILDKSRLNNRQASVTGLLLCDGRQFLQALEGPLTDVEVVFERIRTDPRHNGIAILSSRDVAHREFGNWTMAANDDSEEAFCTTVAVLVGGVTCPLLRAKFLHFAAHP